VEALSGAAASADGESSIDPSTTQLRLVNRLLHRWREAACDGVFPSIDHIDPWVIGDDWKDCLLIAIETPVEASRLIAIGEHLLVRPQWQWQTLSVAEVPGDSLISAIASRLHSVVALRDCVIDEGETATDGGMILYRCALLPLAADGVEIDHVLAAVNCKIVPVASARQSP